jgi:hypothetical protein
MFAKKWFGWWFKRLTSVASSGPYPLFRRGKDLARDEWASSVVSFSDFFVARFPEMELACVDLLFFH